MKVLKIAIHGANGRMGRSIQKELEKYREYAFAGAVTRKGNVPVCDVVIDVSSPEGTIDLLEKMNGQALIVGTTGHANITEIKAYSLIAPVMMVPNFSKGIRIIKNMIAAGLQDLSQYEAHIEGVHHKNKKITPSGTSLVLASVIAKHTGKEVPVESVCMGETAGEHTVVFENTNERIEIRHIVKDQAAMAEGAIVLAHWIVRQPADLYHL